MDDYCQNYKIKINYKMIWMTHVSMLSCLSKPSRTLYFTISSVLDFISTILYIIFTQFMYCIRPIYRLYKFFEEILKWHHSWLLITSGSQWQKQLAINTFKSWFNQLHCDQIIRVIRKRTMRNGILVDLKIIIIC